MRRCRRRRDSKIENEMAESERKKRFYNFVCSLEAYIEEMKWNNNDNNRKKKKRLHGFG